LGSGDAGLELAEESSVSVLDDGVKAGTSDSSPEVEELLLLGYKSGALYDSMFVVERSSTGAEILCLIVPAGKEFFIVRLL
jgi:hypothetical protein